LLRRGGRCSGGRSRCAFATAAAATPFAPLASAFGLASGCCLLLLRARLLLLTILLLRRRLRTAVAIAITTTLASASLLLSRRLRPCIRAGRTRPATIVLDSGALFELLHLLLHELARLRILPRAKDVETAVGAAPPTLRIHLFTRGAEDTFGQRHGRAGALYTSRRCSLGTSPRAAKPCRH
jgi:hypothetical protein